MLKKILPKILAIIMGISLLVSSPVLAADCYCDKKGKNPGITTSILGSQAYDKNGKKIDGVKCKCDKDGSSVISILGLVVDIMSIGIGILGVIGITIVGIQYLTAGGSEEKTRKAKRRMFEIVIGIVAYVLLYWFLKWLLPVGIK